MDRRPPRRNGELHTPLPDVVREYRLLPPRTARGGGHLRSIRGAGVLRPQGARGVAREPRDGEGEAAVGEGAFAGGGAEGLCVWVRVGEG